ncbi:MAG: B12-binding domain-containing protein [Phycisphaerales bacterium]
MPELTERFFESLISGDRPGSRRIVEEALATSSPSALITDLFWPTYEMIERLYRSDQLGKLSHHLATRLLRVLVDQNAARLTPQAARGRSVLALCGPRDSDELGAQMAVDLIERSGFEVRFGGGGIASDEIMAHIHNERPQVLLMFASGANDLPQIRQMIDQLHEIGACPDLQIVVGAGVFNRADGLAEEIGADLWARNPLELVEVLVEEPERRFEANQRSVGRTKKKVRRDAA